MKIEEVVGIYNFLGNLNFVGFLGVCILLIIGVYLIVYGLKDAISPLMKIVIICIAFISLYVLYNQAQKRNKYLIIGNTIKQDFMTSLYKQKTFSEINKIPSLNLLKEKDFDELAKLFPDEFLVVELEQRGICMIETKTIDELNGRWKEKAILSREMIINYLNVSNAKKIDIGLQNDTSFTFKKIDYQAWLIGADFFKFIPGGNLIPEYNAKWEITGFKLIDKGKITSVPSK